MNEMHINVKSIKSSFAENVLKYPNNYKYFYKNRPIKPSVFLLYSQNSQSNLLLMANEIEEIYKRVAIRTGHSNKRNEDDEVVYSSDKERQQKTTMSGVWHSLRQWFPNFLY